MSVEKNVDWCPPKENGDIENIIEFYARIFVDEVVAGMCMETMSKDHPIAQEIVGLTKETDAIFKYLKENGNFTDQLFLLYKKIRKTAYEKAGRRQGVNDPDKLIPVGSQVLKNQFHKDMSTAEALTLARKIVKEWDLQQFKAGVRDQE